VSRTRASTVIVLIAIGMMASAFLETALASTGRPILVPPITLPIALATIGLIILLLALPIHRRIKGTRKAPIDPFYATRVVMLAKASSISGAFLLGAGGGVIFYLSTRSAAPATGSLAMAISTAAGAAILLSAGLIAEHMCTIPPASGEDEAHSGNEPAPVS
jgi:hypothetical protein